MLSPASPRSNSLWNASASTEHKVIYQSSVPLTNASQDRRDLGAKAEDLNCITLVANTTLDLLWRSVVNS